LQFVNGVEETKMILLMAIYLSNCWISTCIIKVLFWLVHHSSNF